MIADLKPYAEYKTSAQSWFGDVPTHWTVMPNRAIFAEVKDRNHPDEEMLSVTITRGIVKQKALLEGSSKKDSSNQDKSAYKLVQPRDIAYNKMRAWQGAIGASTLRGIISPAYVVMRLRNADDLPRYFHHLYRTPQFAKEAERWSYGITSDMWSLRPEHFRMIYTPEPPSDEQDAIVRFLDWANGRLDRAILAKRKVIALLNEQKQVIIHCAVTRGLDPSVPFKPSGIPWLGDMPAHWSLTPNRSLFHIRKVLVGPRHTEYQLLSLTKIGIIVRDMTTGKGKFSNFWERSQEVRPGDLVFCLFDVDETPRTVGLSRHLGMISGDYTVMECSDRMAGTFVESFYKAMDDRKLLSPLYTGLRKRISKPLLLAAKTPMPPPDEQLKIVRFIDKTTSEVDQSIGHLRKQISILTEYRTRLVADVVTGKLDVRDAATKLPVEELANEAGDELVDEASEIVEDEITEPVA
jgi:type I restriction enzyme, S subunit